MKGIVVKYSFDPSSLYDYFFISEYVFDTKETFLISEEFASLLRYDEEEVNMAFTIITNIFS